MNSVISVDWKSRALMNLWLNPEKTNRKLRGDQWKPAKNPPMVKLAFLWLSVNCKSQKIKIPYSFIDERLYSMRGAVTCLVTVPIVRESKRLGGNFHNWCGSLIIQEICISQRLDLTSDGTFSHPVEICSVVTSSVLKGRTDGTDGQGWAWRGFPFFLSLLWTMHMDEKRLENFRCTSVTTK